MGAGTGQHEGEVDLLPEQTLNILVWKVRHPDLRDQKPIVARIWSKRGPKYFLIVSLVRRAPER